MTSWKPYVWKEVHQSRRLALGGLGVFLAISFIPSAIASIRSQGHWYNGNPLAAMFLAGPILAVVAGVYAMGREQGAVEQFWRARPVNLHLWLLSKYVIGLALVWLACWTPLVITMLARTFEPRDAPVYEGISMPLAYSFILLLIFSASFVLGQLVRGGLHAAILALAAMALIFIMPLAIAPLNWLSLEVLQRVDTGARDLPSYIAFAAGMTGLGIALLALAGILLKRNVKVDVDQRTLSWSVVVILLVLAAGVAFPMRTNLPAQQMIRLPVDQEVAVQDMAADGNEMLILLSSGPERGSSRGRKYGLVRVHVGRQTSVVDPPRWFVDPGKEPKVYYNASDLAWSAEKPSLAYVVVSRQDVTRGQRTDTLYTIALDAKQSNPVVHRIELNSLLNEPWPTLALHQDHLYVYEGHDGARLLTFSLADPRTPSLIHTRNLEQRIGFPGPGWPGSSSEYAIQLAPLGDLDASARLEVTHQLAPYGWTLLGDGRVLASVLDSRHAALRLMLFETGLRHDSVIPLHPVAQRQAGAIERVLRSYGGRLYGSDGLACRLTGFGATVYDIRDPQRIARVGHYAAGGGFSAAAVLPDNRVVIAGEGLHVLDLSSKLAH